ncbi:hypothetical protein NMK54_28225 [Nocardia otitidiscaviarum]|uniref:hypothetical protein n=1 Tax=Nocardia otitidiscaviarum TaxID=1823 RepID=UPI001FD188C8|nr:hypothetical protein [Nocardia otitidiscaviarum]MCP9624036.1 hypothetical protein [Nocardia otitidiscaviarum]
MSEASVEVLLDDFEDKGNWELGGAGAERTHLTTFAEGAPNKEVASFADGAAGRDYRALVLLIRRAADDFEVDLVAKAGRPFTIAGELTALRLWVRSPHAAIRVHARLESEQGSAQAQFGTVPAGGEWQHVELEVPQPMTDASLVGLRVRLMHVVKQQGEVMILLDDLTATTTR